MLLSSAVYSNYYQEREAEPRINREEEEQTVGNISQTSNVRFWQTHEPSGAGPSAAEGKRERKAARHRSKLLPQESPPRIRPTRALFMPSHIRPLRSLFSRSTFCYRYVSVFAFFLFVPFFAQQIFAKQPFANNRIQQTQPDYYPRYARINFQISNKIFNTSAQPGAEQRNARTSALNPVRRALSTICRT